MNEIQTNTFDYSLVDKVTSDYLKEKEAAMKEIVNNASENLGKELYEAQQRLAKNGYGCFEEWYTSLGFKQRNVYHYINRYSFLQNLQNQKEIETFQELSPSLQNEVSKPSAKKEVNQAVFDGDIKTHKEYKELERKLKESEQREKAERQERERLEKENEELANREPEVIEKEVEDKTKINELTKEINQLKIRLEQESNDAKTYRKLRGDIERLSTEKDDIIRRIESAGTIGEFISRAERAFTEDLAPIKYTRAIRETSDSPAVIESVNSILETVEEWAKEIRREVPELNYYTEVIEHE